jgi:Protein of unknown function (DUF2973)
MLAVTLTITTLVSLLFFFVGCMLGWIVKQHFYERDYVSSMQNIHPEMFDNNGNLIPDEIIAVRFENDYDYDEDEEEN